MTESPERDLLGRRRRRALDAAVADAARRSAEREGGEVDVVVTVRCRAGAVAGELLAEIREIRRLGAS